MNCLIRCVFLIFSASLINCEDELDWWVGGNFYQIYPRSWMDSNGDGVGDLQGIKSKIQYLKDIGIDGVWLSPIFKSPMVDYGYDISDFRDIHNEFGTMKDFEELLNECKRIGLKLILDFVCNHSSDEHEWFTKSVNGEPGYEDYYVWHPGKIDPQTSKRIPPNNWLSAFRYSAWTYNETRKAMYYHKNLPKQPDLNYRNPKVVQEVLDILTFWLKKGVSGFRVDAIPTIFEVEADETGYIPDEPRTFDPNCDSNDACYLNHTFFTEDRDETYEMAYKFRLHLDNFKKMNGDETRLMMSESYAPIPLTHRYYGDGKKEGAQIPFNFELIMKIDENSTARDYKNIIEAWIDEMPKGYYANWVVGNHDRHRVASRIGPSKGDLINILVQTLPGVAITYQGEELVLENVVVSWEDTQDPLACNTNPQVYHKISRDPCRTPFPWDDSKNAGFSTGDKTWLPVGDKYKTDNVKAQLTAPNSHLKIFMKLLKLRKKLVMRSGDYVSVLTNNDNVLAYKREYKGEMVFIILNFANSTQSIDLKSEFGKAPNQLKVFTSSLGSGLNDGEIMNASNIQLKSDNGLVLVMLDGSEVVPTTQIPSTTPGSGSVICLNIFIYLIFMMFVIAVT